MNRKNHQGRVYFATEYTLAQQDRTTKTFETTGPQGSKIVHTKIVPKDDAGYSKGYRAVIWAPGGKMVWQSEVEKLDMHTDPSAAFAAMRDHATTIGAPVDLWRHGNEYAETVG